MSAKLAMRVLESGLSPTLKPLLTTMALFGNDAGERIYPSVDRLAHLLGVTSRSVSRQLAELREIKALVPVPESSMTGGRLPGGRGRSVLYRLDIEALPARATYKPRHPRQGFEEANPDASVRVKPPVNFPESPKTLSPAANTLTPVTNTLTPVTENPDASVTRSLRRNLRENVRENVREEKPTALRADSLSPEKTQEIKPPEDKNHFDAFMETLRSVSPKVAASWDRERQRGQRKERDPNAGFKRLAEI